MFSSKESIHMSTINLLISYLIYLNIFFSNELLIMPPIEMITDALISSEVWIVSGNLS